MWLVIIYSDDESVEEVSLESDSEFSDGSVSFNYGRSFSINLYTFGWLGFSTSVKISYIILV